MPTFEVWRSNNTLATGCCGQTPVTHSFSVPNNTITRIDRPRLTTGRPRSSALLRRPQPRRLHHRLREPDDVDRRRYAAHPGQLRTVLTGPDLSAAVPPWDVPRFGHSHLEFVAREAGIDVMHVKGPAMDERLLGGPRSSTDADVLLRPAQVRALFAVLREHGLRPLDSFATSFFVRSSHPSPTNVGRGRRPRAYPGFHVDPDHASTSLDGRHRPEVACTNCTVPSLPAQLLVLLLHAARSRSGRGVQDSTAAWERADDALRVEVRLLAVRLRAEVPLAVALGEDLSPFEGRRELALWRSIDHPTTRSGVAGAHRGPADRPGQGGHRGPCTRPQPGRARPPARPAPDPGRARHGALPAGGPGHSRARRSRRLTRLGGTAARC